MAREVFWTADCDSEPGGGQARREGRAGGRSMSFRRTELPNHGAKVESGSGPGGAATVPVSPLRVLITLSCFCAFSRKTRRNRKRSAADP